MTDFFRIEAKISQDEYLPVLPVITQNIIQLTFDPEKALKDIARIVSKDAAFSARFIKIVNFSFSSYSIR